MKTKDLTPEMRDNAFNLLDRLTRQAYLKNDAALARYLGVKPPVISKVRSGKLAVGLTLQVRIHRRFGYTIESILEQLGYPDPDMLPQALTPRTHAA